MNPSGRFCGFRSLSSLSIVSVGYLLNCSLAYSVGFSIIGLPMDCLRRGRGIAALCGQERPNRRSSPYTNRTSTNLAAASRLWLLPSQFPFALKASSNFSWSMHSGTSIDFATSSSNQACRSDVGVQRQNRNRLACVVLMDPTIPLGFPTVKRFL